MKVSFANGKGVWLAYYGLDANGRPSHSDKNGHIVLNVPSATPTDAIAFPVPDGPFFLPMLDAARLYVSLEEPLLFAVDPTGKPIPPSAADPKDPNYLTAWDFFEVTYVMDGTDGLFNFNLSNVQSVNLPLAFHVTGLDPSSRKPVDYSRGWVPGGYEKFLTSIYENQDFFKLVLTSTQRVLAPGTAITAFVQKVISEPLFNEDYLKSYIREVWAKYEGTDMIFVGDPPPHSNTFVTWKGRVVDGQFVFKTNDLPGLVPIVLNEPTTADMLENNFTFCASGGGTPGSLQANYALQLFGTLCAAFNRSMMLSTFDFANSANCKWCKDTDKWYPDPITNYYAKLIHRNVIDGRAYAFQSDDHCDVSSYVSVLNPEQLTLSLVDV